MAVKVSIIVAVNNGGDKLSNCLDSIKNQSLRDIEVIMVDALSSDNTAEIMRSYLSDGRFKFFSFSQESVSEGRNFALTKAQGKYIAYGASNVVFTKNLFKEMFETAEDKNADLCVSPMASSDIYGKHEFSSASTLSEEKLTDKFDINLIWNPAVTNKLFRREKVLTSETAFRRYGKAREAAFSLPFAFNSNLIACIKDVVLNVDCEVVFKIPNEVEHKNVFGKTGASRSGFIISYRSGMNHIRPHHSFVSTLCEIVIKTCNVLYVNIRRV